MYSKTKSGSKEAPYVVELVADTQDDIEKLPTHYAPGSTCVVIEGSRVFMLNNEHEWKEL